MDHAADARLMLQAADSPCKAGLTCGPIWKSEQSEKKPGKARRMFVSLFLCCFIARINLQDTRMALQNQIPVAHDLPSFKWALIKCQSLICWSKLWISSSRSSSTTQGISSSTWTQNQDFRRARPLRPIALSKCTGRSGTAPRTNNL
jgi:hypothetical protein